MAFSVVLNSVRNFNSVASGQQRSSLQYAFDWTSVPQGKYKLGYSFISRSTAVNDIIYISLPDIGCNFHSYTASSGTTAYSTNILGMAMNWYGGNNIASPLFQQYLNNPPLYLSSLPTNNLFTVNLLQYDGVTPYTNGGSWTAPQNFDYTLVLYFEKVED